MKKNFYKNFKTKEDLKKEITRLSNQASDPNEAILLISNSIAGFVFAIQKGTIINFVFDGNIEVSFDLKKQFKNKIWII